MKSKAIKALYVVPFAFLEALTVSFYQNVRKRLDGKSRKNHYICILFFYVYLVLKFIQRI